MITLELTKDLFIDAFDSNGRGAQFSFEALCELYDYLDAYFEDANYKLDVIAICSEFAEDTEDFILAEYEIETMDDFHGWYEALANGNIVYSYA